MLDRLIDLLIQFLGLFKFWIIVEPFEQVVVTRLGRNPRVLENGLHWLAPLHIDSAISEHIVPTTHTFADSSATSKDGKSIGFCATVTYRVKDVIKATMEVSAVDHAIHDASSGEIGRIMRASTWEQMLAEDFCDVLTAACRKRAWKYGVEIITVQLSELCLCRTIRLMSYAK